MNAQVVQLSDEGFLGDSVEGCREVEDDKRGCFSKMVLMLSVAAMRVVFVLWLVRNPN